MGNEARNIETPARQLPAASSLTNRISTAQSWAETRHAVPLVVDLDGTLTPCDTLAESAIKAVKHHPATLLHMPLWPLKGRAFFKRQIATAASDHFNPAALPYNEPLLDYLRSERARGRQLILATAADRRIADAVATHLGLFDMVLASDGSDNLKGRNKLKKIERAVGQRFAYAGDHAADLPIWQASSAAVLVGVSPQVERSVRTHCVVEHTFPKQAAGVKGWVRALRMHQWIKNVLLFVPLLTGFSLFDTNKLMTMALAFLAFSLVASATYIVNDLLDLDSDRVHPRKRTRPFASAQISIFSGAIAGMVMLGGGLLIFNMGLGEVAPGGTGTGIYGILIVAVVAVFIAGLMVGRTPEYLHKKITGREIKLVSLYILTTPVIVLAGTGIAISVFSAKASILNPGPHGLSEVLYAFMSTANNNGSAFAGLSGNTNFYNIALGLTMLAGRLIPILLALGLAGSLARQRLVPATAGTLPTHTALFVLLLAGVIIIVAGLTFFPAMALGPLAECL